MNYIGMGVGGGGVTAGVQGVGTVAGVDDLKMGGDVGVTLRCGVYRAGVGVVHELCSSQSTVSAALCIERRKYTQQVTLYVPRSSQHWQTCLS